MRRAVRGGRRALRVAPSRRVVSRGGARASARRVLVLRRPLRRRVPARRGGGTPVALVRARGVSRGRVFRPWGRFPVERLGRGGARGRPLDVRRDARGARDARERHRPNGVRRALPRAPARLRAERPRRRPERVSFRAPRRGRPRGRLVDGVARSLGSRERLRAVRGVQRRVGSEADARARRRRRLRRVQAFGAVRPRFLRRRVHDRRGSGRREGASVLRVGGDVRRHLLRRREASGHAYSRVFDCGGHTEGGYGFYLDPGNDTTVASTKITTPTDKGGQASPTNIGCRACVSGPQVFAVRFAVSDGDRTVKNGKQELWSTVGNRDDGICDGRLYGRAHNVTTLDETTIRFDWGKFKLGAQAKGMSRTSRYMKGDIAEFRAYRGALSDRDVRAIMDELEEEYVFGACLTEAACRASATSAASRSAAPARPSPGTTPSRGATRTRSGRRRRSGGARRSSARAEAKPTSRRNSEKTRERRTARKTNACGSDAPPSTTPRRDDARRRARACASRAPFSITLA